MLRSWPVRALFGGVLRLVALAIALISPQVRAQVPSPTATRPPELSYLADGLTATPFREGSEGRLVLRPRPITRAGLILQRRAEDGSSTEYGLLRSGSEVRRFMAVRGDGTSIAADGSGTLWVAVTTHTDTAEGGVSRLFTIQGLEAIAKPAVAAKSDAVGVSGIAIPELAAGAKAYVAGEIARDPNGGGWELAPGQGVLNAESRLGLLRLRESVFDERGAQPGLVALDIMDGSGGLHPIAEVILPWNERDGLGWMMPSLLVAPDGAVWLNALQSRGSDRVEQWVRIEGIGEVLKSYYHVSHDDPGQWSGGGYPPQQATAFKPLLPRLSVKQVAPCSDVSLSGALVSTLGLVVADGDAHSKVTFRLLTADGTERDLLQVINMPGWSAAVDFDDVLWIQSTAYQTGSMGSFRDCRQVWRVDGLRAALSVAAGGAP